MGPTRNAKATKKFEKKHLKGVLERRKTTAKIKQRQQVKEKKAARRAKDREFYKSPQNGDNKEGGASRPNKAGANVSKMSVDDFFSGGFEMLDKPKPAEQTGGKLGKRKRDVQAVEAEQQDASDGESSIEADSFSDDELSAEKRDAQASEDELDLEDDDEHGVGMTKDAMAQLAMDDPEFHQFFKENDSELLDFDEDADLGEIDDLSGSEEEKDEQPAKKKQRAGDKKKKTRGTEDDDESGDIEDEFSTGNELTKQMVARWKQAMSETHSLRATRQMVLAFRSAAHLNEEDAEGKKNRYSIHSPEVFHDVLVTALEKVPEVLQHHVPVKESAAGKVHFTPESKKFKALSILIRSHTASVLHLVGTLSDDATLKLTLSSLTPLLPYLLSFRKLLKTLIRTVVALWSQPASSESTRITAFLVLRRLCVIGDKGVRETLLKAAYQGLVQGCRTTNINTIQGINLMKTSAAELWGIDANIGYTTAFTLIRQLAIHLRNSIVNNQNDAYRKVYNWQYVHSLDFWSCVLAEHCNSLREAEAGKESPLRLLIYPLVQVTLGAMRLIPTAGYFPLRFHAVRALLRLSRATATYIPLAAPLLEVLQSAEMRRPPRPSTLKPLDFAVNYKCSKAYLRTRVYQDGVGEQVVELLAEFAVLWATNIAFPELSLPVVIMLKRWLKEARGSGSRSGRKAGGGRGSGSNNAKLASALTVLVQKLEANGRFIEERRAKVDFAPKDRAQVDAFLKDFAWEESPLGAYVVGQRRMRAERQKVMEAARREEEKKWREERQEGEAQEEADEEEEEEEEMDIVGNDDDDDDDGEDGEE